MRGAGAGMRQNASAGRFVLRGQRGRSYHSGMSSNAQRTRFIGYRESGDDYVYMELDLDFDGGQAPEWIVERLPGKRYQRWRRSAGIAEPGVPTYVADSACDEQRLISAGYGDCLRVEHPDTVL